MSFGEEKERKATYDFSTGKKHPMVLDINRLPLIHHYSWVRTKQEAIRKVNTWGHFADKNWATVRIAAAFGHGCVAIQISKLN